MSFRSGLRRSFLRSTDSDGASEPVAPPHLAVVDVDPPADAPDKCPNCGGAFDAEHDLAPPDVDLVDYGDHSHACRIGTAHSGPLAGWTVIHRD